MSGDIVRYEPSGVQARRNRNARQKALVDYELAREAQCACYRSAVVPVTLTGEMQARLAANMQRLREEHPEAAAFFEPIQLDERLIEQLRAQRPRRLDADWRL